MYMYRYELYKGDDATHLLADDFSAPAEVNSVVLEDRVIRELNRKVANTSFEEHDKFGSTIDYLVKVHAHFIADASQPNAAMRGEPVSVFPIYLIEPNEFHKKPEVKDEVG